MRRKIFGMFIFLLLISSTITLALTPFSSDGHSIQQLHRVPNTFLQIDPEGKILFTARATGPCAIAWGYGFTNETNPPGGYIEPAKGIIINFGTMPYHRLNGFFTNYLYNGNEVEVLWNIKEKTLMSIDWQHKDIKHHIQVTCTPLPESTGVFFTNATAYFLTPPIYTWVQEHPLNCMAFAGIHRNGSKTESISGYAILLANAEENSPMFPQPLIYISLFQNTDEGESKSLLIAGWTKNDWKINDVPIEKANTFHVNYWTL